MDITITAQIVSLTRAGVRRRDIAAQLGISPWSVSQVRREAGLRHSASVVTARRAIVAAHLAAGLTVTQISRLTGWSWTTIKKDEKALREKV